MRDVEWIKKGYFAHRGLHNEKYPENTLNAFQNAVNNDFGIELDIRMTLDKKIVVIHDNNLLRLTGVDINVDQVNYSNLVDLKIMNTDSKISLLSDVLLSLPESTELLIELKPSKTPKKLVKSFILLMSKFKHKYAIHSFDPRILIEFKRQDKDIIRGQISETFKDRTGIWHFALKHLLFNGFTKPDFINYNFDDLPRKRLDRLHRKGMLIISFTARCEKDLSYVKNIYDNAVFENFIPQKK